MFAGAWNGIVLEVNTATGTNVNVRPGWRERATAAAASWQPLVENRIAPPGSLRVAVLAVCWFDKVQERGGTNVALPVMVYVSDPVSRAASDLRNPKKKSIFKSPTGARWMYFGSVLVLGNGRMCEMVASDLSA